MDAHDSHATPTADDEPKTPMWLPALGGALFLVAGIWWATRPVYYAPAPSATVSAAPVAAASSAAPAASAPIRMPPPMPNASNAQPVPRRPRH